MNPADRAIAQKIRKAIHDDANLSMYAHNIKIITQDGKVDSPRSSADRGRKEQSGSEGGQRSGNR